MLILPGLPGLLGLPSLFSLFEHLFYPALPGDDVLLLHGPLFSRAVVHLARGDLSIIGSSAGANTPHVQNLAVNGKPATASWLRFATLSNGGTMSYNMGATANPGWGTSGLPPSYTEGTPVAAPRPSP